MTTAILTLLGVALMAALLGSVLIVDAVRHAPDGFESEDGFHAVRESGSRPSPTASTTSSAIEGTPALLS